MQEWTAVSNKKTRAESQWIFRAFPVRIWRYRIARDIRVYDDPRLGLLRGKMLGILARHGQRKTLPHPVDAGCLSRSGTQSRFNLADCRHPERADGDSEPDFPAAEAGEAAIYKGRYF